MKKRERHKDDRKRADGDEKRGVPELSHAANGTRLAFVSMAPEHPCPRCGASLADAEYYGICAGCAEALRSNYDGEARGEVTAVEYEPKMNVTPNAVALKE